MASGDESDLEAGIVLLLTSVMQLQLAERAIENRIGAELGLSQSDVLALALLVRTRHQTVGRIAADLDLTAGSASLLVTRLTRAGLVVRLPSPTDRRSVLIEVTERGAEVVRSIGDRYAEAVRAAAGIVTITDACIHTAAHVIEQTALHLRSGAQRHRIPPEALPVLAS